MSIHVSPASDDERAGALRLFFKHVAATEREARCERALALIAQGELPPEGLLVCRRGDTLLGAITALPMAGAAGLLWPPQVVDVIPARSIEEALIQAATAWLRQRGAKFVQALLTPADFVLVQPLLRHGFRHITSLLHMQRALDGDVPRPAGLAGLHCESYTTCDPHLFNTNLLATYEQTLDCPELNDIRTASEILAGYSAVPGSRQDRWWLAWYDNNPVGVLIMMPIQEPPAWEMAYMGLVPAARRQGFGRELTLLALLQSEADGADRMTLTVDARNHLARRLYASLGFEEFDRREVCLLVFPKT